MGTGTQPPRSTSLAASRLPLLALALAVLTAGTVIVLTATASAGGSRPDVAPANGALLGAYVQPTDWSASGQQAAVEGLERAMGRPLDIDHIFYQWTQAFPTWRQTWDVQNGRIPMISWAPTSSAAIDSGSEDAWIRSEASAVHAFGAPLFIRWFGEMEAPGNSGNAGTPAQFIAAWQRMYSIFQQQGATNAMWVWCPDASAFGNGLAQSFYPGDDYVDWLCADAYNWSPLTPGGGQGGTWRSFDSIFAPFYNWAIARGKPLMAGETGVQEGSPGAKADWLQSLGSILPSRDPAFKAVVYFSALSSSRQGGSFDWRLTSSQGALSAFARLSQEPYFDTRSGPGPDPSPSPSSSPSPSPSSQPSPSPSTSQPPSPSPSTSRPPSPSPSSSRPPSPSPSTSRPPSPSPTETTPPTPTPTDTSQTPAAPSGLHAVARLPYRVGLSWNAPSGAPRAYRIIRDGRVVGSTSSTSWTDTSVLPTTTYRYEVAAVGRSGQLSPPSRAAMARTPSTLFFDGFEHGGMAGWPSRRDAHVGSAGAWYSRHGAVLWSRGAGAFAMRRLSAARRSLSVQAMVKLGHRPKHSVDVLVLRDGAGRYLTRVQVTPYGTLRTFVGLHHAAPDRPAVPMRQWVELTARVEIHGGQARVTVWVEGVRLSTYTARVASHTVRAVQLGDHRPGRSYRIVIDNVRWDTRLIPA
ncbi:MAG TPA: glycosyl hydrolase [Actinomycetota bacterium]